MLSTYPAIFYEEENGQYSVIFPDLEGLSTFGNDFVYAYNMAIDCLAGHLYSLKNDEEINLPKPSSIKDIDPKAYADSIEYTEYNDSIVNMVSVDVDAYAKEHFEKSVRKSVTISSWLNKEAEEAGINFSKTLQEAIITKSGL